MDNYKTEAMILVEPNKDLRLLELQIPKLQPGQVLVDVAYSGICHSQLLEVRGRRGLDRFLPHTLGHEGSGTVLKVGENVHKVKPGDHVILTWIKGHGADVPSTLYKSEIGNVNSGAISTFMRRTITCENRLVPIPKNFPMNVAALLGCAVPTGAGIVLNTLKVRPGSSVAIFGVGGVGLCAVLAAKLCNATKIIAVDIDEGKLDYAEELGATHSVNASESDVLIEILQITQQGGVDFAIESAGLKETMETAFRSVRRNGGTCVIAGNLPFGEVIELDPMELIRGKRILGTWGGESQPDSDIPMYVDLFMSGKFDLEKLITHEYQLSEINQALDDLEKGQLGRTLVNMNASLNS